MNRFATGYPLLALTISLGAGCAPDDPSVTAPVESVLARGKPASAAYTSSDLGALLGANSSQANGVNDASDVVGFTSQPSLAAFAILNGVATTLSGESGNAKAISNGSPQYVVGFAGSTSAPARWTIVSGAPSAPEFLALLSNEVGGTALGVNDAGAAVGTVFDTAGLGHRAAMWSGAGVRTTVEPPAGRGFVNGEGRDIDNAGHAVFVFFEGNADEVSPARGFLRLASGNLVELVPLAGDVTTYANGLSEVQNNTVYIAGTSRTSQFVFRAVRWTVDVTNGAILATEVRSENSHALGVSTDGATVGFVETNAARTPRFTAFLWRGNNFLALVPPKGARDGRAWAVSASGEFVAGDAAVGLSRTAILWTILSP